MNWFAKKVFDRGGVRPKKQEKSTRYLCKILNFVKFYIKKIPDATSRCRGAILIEFAICMPVLIILLFYIHDLVKIKRLYSQTEFIGHQMANILQNISQKRENKAITKTDIKHACSLAWLTIPYDDENYAHPYTFVYYVTGPSGGSSGYSADFKSKEGLDEISRRYNSSIVEYHSYNYSYSGMSKTSSLSLYLFSVNRDGFNPVGVKLSNGEFINAKDFTPTDPGKASCLWGIYSPRYSRIYELGDEIYGDVYFSTVRWGENVEPSAIYPTLKVDDNKGKIIIETLFFCNPRAAKTMFGLRLVNPRPTTSSNYSFFSSVVIFQPKSGLFSTTAPKD